MRTMESVLAALKHEGISDIYLFYCKAVSSGTATPNLSTQANTHARPREQVGESAKMYFT